MFCFRLRCFMSILKAIVCLKLLETAVATETLYLSKNCFINEEIGLINGGLLVDDKGIITKVLKSSTEISNYKNDTKINVIDFGSKILMPGLIDTHVHINEPGREDWEGFVTATKAAAAGGFTTIADMPLNSIPSTTTVENFNKKLKVAKGKIFVDVAFWGGLVPENLNDLQNLIANGVVGFKCFLSSSGVPEFSYVNKSQIEEALKKLENTGTVLAIHAELETQNSSDINTNHPEKYQTYLDSKPSSMEIEAIQMISEIAPQYNVGIHIVHLSAADALPIIEECRKNGAKLTVETCHHYLTIASEDIPDYHTEFKCSPPIREKSNQHKLWQGVLIKQIDQVVSDHSPSPASMKYLLNDQPDKGNFLKAWGGISSNQFGLSLFWTNSRKYNLEMRDIYRLMTLNPSKLLGIDNQKGKFLEGFDADFCVWDPEEEFVVTPEIIEFKNKITPYMNSTLRGRVHGTYVRGHKVFHIYEEFGPPTGELVLRKHTKKQT